MQSKPIMSCMETAYIANRKRYLLVWFIQQINKSKDEVIKYPYFMRVINGLLVIAVIVTVACWCCLGRKTDPAPNSQSQYSVSVEFKNKPETKPE